MPILVVWNNGPGQLQPSCYNTSAFGFVDNLKAFEHAIHGELNLSRFRYWLNSFEYMRAIGNTQCAWKTMLDVEAFIANASKSDQKTLARTRGLPARSALVQNTTVMMNELQHTLSPPGELGKYLNIESHSLLQVLNATTLTTFLGTPLPPEALPPKLFTGETPLLIVPVARSAAQKGETVWRGEPWCLAETRALNSSSTTVLPERRGGESG